MSFLASLSHEAMDELDSYIREVVRRELAAPERADARREWLTIEEVADMLGTTENAIRCRLHRGWLEGHVTRDGKRLLTRKAAVLDELERGAGH